MKKSGLLLLCLCIALLSKAQDIITLTNGNTIQAKVLEITPDDIKYKEFNNPDGPIITIHKAEGRYHAGVVSIKYANGTQAVFGLPARVGKKEGRIHGWYFGAYLNLGAGNATSNDPTYSVAGFVYTGDGLYAVKMFSRHIGIQFGLGADDYTYQVNFYNNAANNDIFAISCLTIPVRAVYLSNSKKRAGMYAMAGLDFSVVTSAKDINSYNLSGYYKTSLVSPYLSAGFQFHTRNAATVFFAGPYFKANLGNLYSGDTNNSLGLSAGNRGTLSSFGISVTCMTNFGRR